LVNVDPGLPIARGPANIHLKSGRPGSPAPSRSA
jgi:hypothetical protein